MNAPLDPLVRAHLERAVTEVTIDDKYSLDRGRAFMSGTQALVRLPMLQRERDRAAGLNTAGFVSGFQGSPLLGLFAAALAGAVLGFLFYNFNPASIFMGDTGSMFLGYVLATTAIQTNQKSSTAVAIAAPTTAPAATPSS